MRVIMLHGTYGNPNENWFPSMADELSDFDVVIPTFPTVEGQSLDAWLKVLDETVGSLRSDDIVVGHSMGAGFLIRALEASEPQGGAIKACLLVSGFLTLLGNEAFDPHNASFVTGPCDFELVKQRAGYVRVYHGSDDPYVPEQLGRTIADSLDADFVSIRNGGHLNAEAGFTTFSELRNQIFAIASKT